jgi:hypothetical protein
LESGLLYTASLMDSKLEIWYWEYISFELGSSFWTKNAFIFLFDLDLGKENANFRSKIISIAAAIPDRSFQILLMEWSASETKIMKAHNLNESLDRHFLIDFRRAYSDDLVHFP